MWLTAIKEEHKYQLFCNWLANYITKKWLVLCYTQARLSLNVLIRSATNYIEELHDCLHEPE